MKSDPIIGLIFLALAILGIVLKKTFYALPTKELKRRAEKEDYDAKKLYKAVAYGASLKIVLWLYIGFTSALSVILLAKVLSVWLSLLIIAPLLYLVFSFLPASRVSKGGLVITRLLSPVLAWLLNYLEPWLSRFTGYILSKYEPLRHTGIYERQDLVEFLDQQKSQPDSRITVKELETLTRALEFSNKKVSDVLLPRKKVKTLLANDTVGPILIDELHKKAQKHVLVKESKKGDIVGTLAFSELGINSHGTVRDVMDDTLYYLNVDDTLSDALEAYFNTTQTMFVVVNEFEEYVGIVTLENIIKELLVEEKQPDFDNYTSIQAVATRRQKTDIEDLTIIDVDDIPVKEDDEVLK